MYVGTISWERKYHDSFTPQISLITFVIVGDDNMRLPMHLTKLHWKRSHYTENDTNLLKLALTYWKWTSRTDSEQIIPIHHLIYESRPRFVPMDQQLYTDSEQAEQNTWSHYACIPWRKRPRFTVVNMY